MTITPDTTTETSNELVVVIEQSGLEKPTADTLLQSFTPFFEQAKEWQAKANALVVTDATQLTEMKQAREARLALKAIRVDADKTRKALKEDSLRYGKAVQGVFNVIEYLIAPIEKHLEEQEKFAERAEANRKEKLKAVRIEALSPYEVQTDFYDLVNMKDSDFATLLSNSKAGFEARKDAERKAEADRIEAERKEQLRRTRELAIAPYMQFVGSASYNLGEETEEEFEAILAKLRDAKAAYIQEQEQIKSEKEKLEKQLAEERAAAEANRIASEKEAARIKAESDKKAAEERARVEAEQEKMRKEAQAKIDAERKERERLQAELKEKEEAAAKLKAEQEAAAEAELAKGDAERMQDLQKELQALTTKYTFKSKKHKLLYSQVVELLNKVINHIIAKQ